MIVSASAVRGEKLRTLKCASNGNDSRVPKCIARIYAHCASHRREIPCGAAGGAGRGGSRTFKKKKLIFVFGSGNLVSGHTAVI